MKNCIMLILIGFYLPAQAQIHFKSFDELLQYADAHAIAIKSAAINEQIAISEKKEVRAGLLPSLNGSLGYNDNITQQATLVPATMFNPEAPEGTFQELTFGTKYQYSRGIQVQWDVLNFQKIFASQTANLQVDVSRVSTEVNRFNTYNQLASTYYAIVLTQESISIYEENLKVSESILAYAKEKYEQGIISQAELNGAEIKQLQNKKNVNMAKSNLGQFYLQLQSQLNTQSLIVVTDTPDNFALANTQIVNPHPEVMLQKAELKKYESLLKQTKATRLPSLSLGYQYNQTWNTNDFLDFANANQIPQQAFGVTLSFSSFLNPSNKQKINQSKRKLELQQLQLENTQVVKFQEDKLLQMELEQASNQLDDNKRILSLREQNDVHAENKYQGGIMSLDQRLDQYDDLLSAQDIYLQSLAAYTLAQYKIHIRQMNFQIVKY